MEPLDDRELPDRELDGMLRQWKAPEAPARLRAAVFPQASGPWWRTMWSASIRVPVPVACGLIVLLGLLWRAVPGSTRVVVRTETVQAPVAERQAKARELRPVAELRPRIIRGPDEN
jgi:hypothetical protein